MISLFKMIKELKEMKKLGGMPFCKEHLLQKVKIASNDKDAIKKLIASGKAKPLRNEKKKCYLCDKDADYLFTIKDAMNAAVKMSRGRK